MDIKNTAGILVFRTTQNNPMKVFIGDDAVTFSMPEGLLKCDIERKGIVSEIACDSNSDLGVKLSDRATIKLVKQKNQVVLYIKAHKTVNIITEKNLNKRLTV
jgi:hypothetical protein